MLTVCARYDSTKTDILAQYREAVGLTQRQVAKHFGLRPDAISQWETGQQRASPSRRERVISYLVDVLELRRDPEAFQKIWTEVMVGEWDWPPLNPHETHSTLREKEMAYRLRAAPFQAVKTTAHFVGRKQEIQTISEILGSPERDRFCVIEGMRGVGKTSLAAHVAHHLAPHFDDGVLWADIGSGDVLGILNAFAAAYNEDVSNIRSIEACSQVVRDILVDKRALVVLDNVESSIDARPLLPPAGPCAVLITTPPECVNKFETLFSDN